MMSGIVIGLKLEIISKLDSYFLMTVALIVAGHSQVAFIGSIWHQGCSKSQFVYKMSVVFFYRLADLQD